ncbi:D-alanyl-D-alanine carboxypeptidase [Nonomuraea jabiensis]|uniref:D-alanyl-D-alanine carboxypeptidase n=1 Tax=Nonomuraea jabiensis TaxID=882448 RepID=UPI0036CD671F
MLTLSARNPESIRVAQPSGPRADLLPGRPRRHTRPVRAAGRSPVASVLMVPAGPSGNAPTAWLGGGHQGVHPAVSRRRKRRGNVPLPGRGHRRTRRGRRQAAGRRTPEPALQAGRARPEPAGRLRSEIHPDFFIGFLRPMARQRYFRDFHRALPIMGRDGTLADVQVDSPAAGHVHAKTGTAGTTSPATGKPLIAKGLAGYIELPDGSWTAFAAFMEQQPTSGDLLTAAGQALGEIATVVYEETSRS